MIKTNPGAFDLNTTHPQIDADVLDALYGSCRRNHISRIVLLLTKKYGLSRTNSTPMLVSTFHNPVILTNGIVLKIDAIQLIGDVPFMVMCSDHDGRSFHHPASHLSTDTLMWLHDHLNRKPCNSIL